jgi:hypothetical protein
VNDQLTGLDAAARSLQGAYEALSSVLRSTPESVQEFRVVTLNPNANQGRSSGAQVALVTRSGGNDFHGAAYWFHRNTATTANDWFNNASGRYLPTGTQVIQGVATAGDLRVRRPKLIRNIFGGALGGPVMRTGHSSSSITRVAATRARPPFSGPFLPKDSATVCCNTRTPRAV